MEENPVKEKSYRFALEIIPFCRELRSRQEYELSRQLMKSGTSVGANVEEALAAVSRADFHAKMGIASKEARESHYWLRLISDSRLADRERISPLLKMSRELVDILTAIVKTTAASRMK